MKTKPLLHDDHPRPVTRRQFLAQGFAASFGWCLLPQAAFALDCESGGPSGLMPFLLFDCAGGAALSGNFVVGKRGGPEDYLESYDRLGVPRAPQNGEPVDARLGAPMYTELSQLRAGLIASTSEEARARLRLATLCSASQDDTSANPLSPALLVAKAGLRGTHFRTGVGTRNSVSGGNSRSPLAQASLKPIFVNGADDVLRSLSYGPALSRLSQNQRSALARTLTRLVGLQAPDQPAVRCGFESNRQYAVPVTGVDPRQDAHCRSVYGINDQTPSATAQIPAVVFNVLNGNAGPGVVTITGCDYHDGTRTTGDDKDREIGQNIGRAVELAHRMQRPLFFAVISDGSCYSDRGTRVWRGDSGTQGLAVIGCYRPEGAVELIRPQVGHYTDGQAVDLNTYLSNQPQRAAYAVLANYLQVNRRLGEFSGLVPFNQFDTGQVDAHLAFA